MARGRTLTDANRLSILFPKIASEWHPTKNGELTAAMVSCSSDRAVYWRCATCSFEFSALIKNRTRWPRCQSCAGRVATPARNLAIEHPHLALQWDRDGNGSVTPESLLSGSDFKASWRCQISTCAHVWSATVNNRSKKGKGCPACSGRAVTDKTRLEILFPEVAAEWDHEKNTRALHTISFGNSDSSWWICATCKYSYHTSAYNRTIGKNGCARCAGRVPSITHNLAATFPLIAAEWHPDNSMSAAEVTPKSNISVQWRCSKCAYEWTAQVCARNFGMDCFRCNIAISRGGTSKIEIFLAFEFFHVLSPEKTTYDREILRPSTPEEGKRIDEEFGSKFMRYGGIRPDIVIDGIFSSNPEKKLIIEWDSSNWHSMSYSVRRDSMKTKIIESAFGHEVLRLREAPLENLPAHEKNCISVSPASYTDVGAIKRAVDSALTHLLSIYSNDLSKISKRRIKEYLSSTHTQADERARNFISQKASDGLQKTLDQWDSLKKSKTEASSDEKA
jgi:DNA-directed RNA polymerase subunit RPC12/RpoP